VINASCNEICIVVAAGGRAMAAGGRDKSWDFMARENIFAN